MLSTQHVSDRKDTNNELELTVCLDNTNSAHLELYTIMGEHDNAGYPLSYCLLSTAASTELGKRTRALTNWAASLRDRYNLRPSFVHTDKDMAEVGMKENVWPEAKHSFCWWHTKRFVLERLGSRKLATTTYHSAVARAIFAFIDPTFKPPGRSDPKEHEGGLLPLPSDSDPSPALFNPDGIRITIPKRIPAEMAQLELELELEPEPKSEPEPEPELEPKPALAPAPEPIGVDPTAGNRRSARLMDATKSNAPATVRKVTLILPNPPVPESDAFETTNESESVEPDEEEEEGIPDTFCPPEHRKPIVEMVESHYCAHPSIPGYCAPNARAIYYWAVKQIYSYCYENALPRAWAYLWGNLYRPARWRLWARSVCPEIPVLKTTMMVEAQ